MDYSIQRLCVMHLKTEFREILTKLEEVHVVSGEACRV